MYNYNQASCKYQLNPLMDTVATAIVPPQRIDGHISIPLVACRLAEILPMGRDMQPHYLLKCISYTIGEGLWGGRLELCCDYKVNGLGS